MMKRWIAGAAVLCLLTAGGAAMAAGHGRGLNYVDANGDGICDHCTGTGLGSYAHHGYGHGHDCK